MKERLKQKKIAARQRLEDIDDEFMPENNPYVVEMLAKEKERKAKLRKFMGELARKRKEIIMKTPQSSRHGPNRKPSTSKSVSRAAPALKVFGNQKR